jgi:CO dehydrogenase/acetyl-CoA synthase delta subunit
MVLLLRLKKYLETIEFLFITKDYFSFEHISIELEILNMKIKMSQRNVTDEDFKNLENYAKNDQNKIIKIYEQIAKHKALNDFYENKYISNICLVLYETNTEEYNTCISDKRIGESNSVEEVKHIVNQELGNIWREYELKKDSENYTSFNEFSSSSYSLLEYINNEYLSKIINIYCDIIEKSNSEFGESIKNNIRSITVVMIIILWLICLYVIFFYINNLIHLLLISRCIFKIIPTRVINQTKDLEDWIDDKY